MELLGSWTTLQQQIQRSLSLFEGLQPPIYSQETLQDTRSLVASYDESRFTQLSDSLEALDDEDNDTIQAVVDRVASVLTNLPPEQARRWRAELVAALVLGDFRDQTRDMSPEDAVSFLDDTMRIVRTVIQHWERWDPA
ncbi:hypothetical protein ACFY3O_00590 [Streptomyces sp. NPDC001046]|uniref:hypothetical protein n=1 Tax=Streptomyces sp. NPDC001046 TaxID=3364543 RepID=UPI00368E2465